MNYKRPNITTSVSVENTIPGFIYRKSGEDFLRLGDENCNIKHNDVRLPFLLLTQKTNKFEFGKVGSIVLIEKTTSLFPLGRAEISVKSD